MHYIYAKEGQILWRRQVTFCTLSADFDLDSLRTRLDEDGLAIAERQEESSKQRRTLAEATKGKLFPRLYACLAVPAVALHLS